MPSSLLQRAVKKLGRNKIRPHHEGNVAGTSSSLTSTESSTGVLPTLICEMVIDCIAGHMRHICKQWWDENIPQTLRACSLTCRAWTPRSQYHLFRFISVRCSQKQVQRVITLLDNNPALRSRIEVLVLRGPGRFIPTLKSIPPQLCEALSEVPELRISQTFVEVAPDSAMVTSLGIFTAVTSLTLYCLYFGTFHDIRRIFTALPRLKAVVLESPNWLAIPRYPSADLVAEPTLLRLKVLRISTSTAWLSHPQGLAFAEWLAHSGVMSSVKTFAVNTMILDERTYTPVRELVESATKTIELLSITFSADFDYTTLHETLERCVKLNTLRLCVPYHLAAFDRLVAFLALPHRLLAVLLIRLREYPQCPPPTTEAWCSLDEVLQGPQWSSLAFLTVARMPQRAPRKFKWGEVYEDLPLNAPAVAKQLRRNMPLCIARGIMWNMLGLSGDLELIGPEVEHGV